MGLSSALARVLTLLSKAESNYFYIEAFTYSFRIQEIDVFQEGNVRIDPVRSFADAGLHPVMLKNVELARYENPTPVQAYCLPAILKGHDVVACAQTGKFLNQVSVLDLLI